jgi:homopolymeric O-antigen transport system permease protein
VAGSRDDLPASEQLVIEPGKSALHYWADLWRYRELLLVFTWRDLAVRYKQTAIGVAWALLQPLAQTVVMVLIFGKLAKMPTQGNAPYALLVFAAILPWQFFASAVSASSMSVVGNAHLVAKVYFPRILLPVSALFTSLADLMITFAILVALMIWYGYSPTWRMLAVPFLVLMAMLAAFGPGVLITALNVEYRDFRFVVPFMVQFGLYVSPVGFSAEVVRSTFGDTLYFLYALNPMVGVIEGFRWAILGGESPLDWPSLAISLGVSGALCWIGIRYFRSMERRFADVI